MGHWFYIMNTLQFFLTLAWLNWNPIIGFIEMLKTSFREIKILLYYDKKADFGKYKQGGLKKRWYILQMIYTFYLCIFP